MIEVHWNHLKIILSLAVTFYTHTKKGKAQYECKWTDKLKATVFNNLFEHRISCSSWSASMLQSTSASSWGAGCWCGRTSSCGSWRHGGADGRNTWEQSIGQSSSDSQQLQILTNLTSHYYKHVVLLAADHLLAVVFLGQLSEGRLDDASSETQHQVEGGLWGINIKQ